MREELTEDERSLLEQLKEYLKNPENTHDMVDWLREMNGIEPPILSPVSPMIMEQAEKDLGFVLPPLLRELYLQIGDGGFGPGYGLHKLTGHEKEPNAIVPVYHMATHPDLPEPRNTWHPRHLELNEWGCGIYSGIDCSTAEGAIYRYDLCEYDDEKSGPLRDFGILEAKSLCEWLTRWMHGENLFEDYRDFGQPE